MNTITRQREFELLRATVVDESTMLDKKLNGSTGVKLFMAPQLRAAIERARSDLRQGAVKLNVEKVKAATRATLAAELSRLRKTHSRLVSGARAEFERCVGYTTLLPDLAIASGSVTVTQGGETFHPLEDALVQLRPMIVLKGKSFSLSGVPDAVRTPGAAEPAGAAPLPPPPLLPSPPAPPPGESRAEAATAEAQRICELTRDNASRPAQKQRQALFHAFKARALEPAEESRERCHATGKTRQCRWQSDCPPGAGRLRLRDSGG
jgi:hypothetical protein